MRIVIELKKDVNANVILNQLYKHTQMQDTFGVIMLALVDGEPKVLNLREMLSHYLTFQEEVVTRRTQYDLDRAKERLHILEGLIIALDNIDEVVEIIKNPPPPPLPRSACASGSAFRKNKRRPFLICALPASRALSATRSWTNTGSL